MRFILEQLVQKKLGYALPPYIAALQDLYFDPNKADAASNMSDGEIVALLNPERAKIDASGYNAEGIFKPSTAYIQNQIFPLRMKLEGDADYWQLPVEPLISLKGKNIIVRRNVAKSKGRGSIKEFWTQDDYDITVQGVFFDANDAHAYPYDDVQKLRRLCESGEVIQVQCDLLKAFEISHFVIEDWDIPFTKGENIQGFTLKCLSDDAYELLIEDERLVMQ